jgi:probable ATP-dependent RNA helicase DDX4
MSRDCPQGGGGGGGGGGKGCFKCGEDGHFSRECPNADANGGDENKPPRSTYVPPPPPETEEEIFKTVQMGINFAKYNEIPVECTGNNAPKQGIARFEDAELHEQCFANIKKAKYDIPTPTKVGYPSNFEWQRYHGLCSNWLGENCCLPATNCDRHVEYRD